MVMSVSKPSALEDRAVIMAAREKIISAVNEAAPQWMTEENHMELAYSIAYALSMVAAESVALISATPECAAKMMRSICGEATHTAIELTKRKEQIPEGRIQNAKRFGVG